MKILTSAILILAYAALAAGLAGCAAKRIPLKNASGEAITRAQVRGDDALTHVKAARPDASPASGIHLDSAATELTSQHADLLEAKKALDAERANAAKLQAQYDKLNGKWYVHLGRWVEASVWILIGGFILYNVAAGLLATSPVGWLAKSGDFLIHFLPAANPAALVRAKFAKAAAIPA